MAGEVVGSVVELWRFPVKSMGGDRLDQTELTEQGVPGDRALCLDRRSHGQGGECEEHEDGQFGRGELVQLRQHAQVRTLADEFAWVLLCSRAAVRLSTRASGSTVNRTRASSE